MKNSKAKQLPKGPYDFKPVEKKWYKHWESKGHFNANPKAEKQHYSILIPPPNLTGKPHMGHALQDTIMDALARFKRMQGFDVLFQPGTDHAGIQLQGKLEKVLLEEKGVTRQELGREKFLKECWKFKEENYESNMKQFKQIGLSADWDRNVFTLDPKPTRAVYTQFKNFWDEGLLYKGPYIVQWCPRCGTAIEDVEMEYEERRDKLYYVKYPLEKCQMSKLKCQNSGESKSEKGEHIKVVVFDLRGPILKADVDFEEELSDREREIWKRGQEMMNDPECWEELGRKFSLTEEERSELIKSFAEKYKVNNKVVKWIKENSKKYKIGVLSNRSFFTKPICEQVLEDKGLDKYIDVVHFNTPDGVQKPDEKVYKEILDDLGVSPNEAVFIDDNAEWTKAAEKIGMQSIVFENEEQVLSDLSKILENGARARILLATSNKDKVKHLKRVLEKLGFEVETADKKIEVKEDKGSLLENAEKKAWEYSKHYKDTLVLATDGGAAIPYLGDKWNQLLTKRFTEKGEKATDRERAEALLDLMKDAQGKEREASWSESFAIAYNGGIIWSKSVTGDKGTILEKIPDNFEETGFWLGYIWFYPQLDKTFVELSEGDFKKTGDMYEQFKEALEKDLDKILPESSSQNPDSYVTIATTRPETMFADVAIAVHPKDKRYTDLVGKKVILPLTKRELEVITDEAIDVEFGTGALKVTPGHDLTDYEIGQRHDLPTFNIVDKEGKLDLKGKGSEAMLPEVVKQLHGLPVNEAREKAVKLLEKEGFVEKVEDYQHSVAICERCKATVEPIISEEWFVKMKGIAQKAVKAIKAHKIAFYPKRYEKILLDWLKEIHDWCISRSLWWGHQLPVWYCTKCNPKKIVKKGQKGLLIYAPKDFDDEPTECPDCKGSKLERDPQALDTWFSSGLWPFSTQGWPENTIELKTYFPFNFEITGPGIKYLWIARMIMLALHHTDKIPWRHMYFHGQFKDEKGRKMSKSLGNAIDPVEMMEQWGADVVRMTLISYSAAGRDIYASRQMMDERCKNYRNFCNKIWNAGKFVLMGIEDVYDELPSLDKRSLELEKEDKEFLKKFKTSLTKARKLFEKFKLNLAQDELYNLFWHEFCDVYIEEVKDRLKGDDEESKRAAQWMLWHALKAQIEHLHPFAPFITEEIWQHLPRSREGESVMFAEIGK